MSTDLLQALQIITKLGVDTVCENLRVLAIDNIALTIEKPRGDLVLCGVLDDGDNSLEFFGSKFTGCGDVSTCNTVISAELSPPTSLVGVDISLLADQIGVTTSNTLYLSQGIDDLLLSVDIGI